jgi:cardiolipin synthase
MSVDHKIAFIGSSNVDIRSFALNLEINLLFFDAEVAAELERRQEDYIRASTLLTADDWASQPAWCHLARNAAKLLSPLL